eukprot:scaffold223957_cov21-Prasinocladus_malaysianus.AAC.1
MTRRVVDRRPDYGTKFLHYSNVLSGRSPTAASCMNDAQCYAQSCLAQTNLIATSCMYDARCMMEKAGAEVIGIVVFVST